MSDETKAKNKRGIYLVGFSGSGKSTIAQLIGRMLQCPVCDLDRLIVQRSGMTIPVIFQKEGETGFRLRETEALREASKEGAFVVATGGGTIVQPENRVVMGRTGWIICLEAQPRNLLARIQKQMQGSEPDAIRPMLDSVDPLEQIRAIKHIRQTAYSLADWTVHTDRLTPEQVAAEVVRAAQLLDQSPEPPAIQDIVGAPRIIP